MELAQDYCLLGRWGEVQPSSLLLALDHLSHDDTRLLSMVAFLVQPPQDVTVLPQAMAKALEWTERHQVPPLVVLPLG